MSITILDSNLIAIRELDAYTSLIWTDRYNGSGDFEIFTSMNYNLYQMLRPNYYIRNSESTKLMIIEKRQLKSDRVNGNQIFVSGRSLESILDRRIVWGQAHLFGNFQEAIQHLLCICIMEPEDETRLIPNFIFEASTDPAITDLLVDTQVLADNLYDVIYSLCEEKSIGFEVVLTEDDQFKFKLYSGVDHSYDQVDNPYVIFSSEFENLLTADHTTDITGYKTVSLVLGPGEGMERPGAEASFPDSAGSGLSRREVYTNASSVSTEVDGVTIPPEDYALQLQYAGLLDLVDRLPIDQFDGQVDATSNFIFGTHFNMGDIVQLDNGYGDVGRARVTEYIRSVDSSGKVSYPTFVTIQ